MNDVITPLAIAASLVMVTAMICWAALSAWRGWLELKRMQLGGSTPRASSGDEGDADAGALIELASVKERLRRLEAIASGVEL